MDPYQSQGGHGHIPTVDTLADHLDVASISGPTRETTPLSKTRKTRRPIYHDIAPSGSSQAFNGLPPSAPANPTAYLSNPVQPSDTMHLMAPGIDPIGRSVTPLRSSYVNSSGQPDLDHLPSVAKARHEATIKYSQEVYPSMSQKVAPPAAVPSTGFDQGNSTPRFARLSMRNVPRSGEELAATGLPLGVVIQPLAPLEGEEPVPVIDFGDEGPPRCQRCRTYVNPFMVFRSGGSKFVCNMCTFANDVPPSYFATADAAGIRTDRESRPELIKGTVEFTVPKEYTVTNPSPLRWMFLIDTSEGAVNRGFFFAILEGIKQALYGEDEDGNTVSRLPVGCRIGIATFDRAVIFYNLHKDLQDVNMSVMSDINDPFPGMGEGLFVDPMESKEAILNLLNRLPELYSGLKSPESAPLSAIMSVFPLLKEQGGKIVCSLSELPTLGQGKLALRNSGDGQSVLSAENPEWVDVAPQLAEAGVGLDFFLAAHNNTFLDTATLGYLSSRTGGDMYYYSNFIEERDSYRVSKDLAYTVTRNTGFAALMKIRCSNGLQISEYHGNFLQNVVGADLQFGSIDQDKCIAAVFSYDGKLDPQQDVHFQSALLYTTAEGQRRVRCCNITATVAKSRVESMKQVDQDAVLGLIAKQAASRVADKPLKIIREGITEKAIDILSKYRKTITESPPQGQLVIPEMLKEFGMYMLGLCKTLAFKGGKVPDDFRVHDLRLVKAMSIPELCLYVYPRIYSLHNLEPQDGFANETGLQMPEPVRASFSKVEEGGVYLIDNGQTCILWFHSLVSPYLLQDLFGPEVDGLEKMNAMTTTLPVLETILNTQVRNILEYLDGSRGSRRIAVQIARAGIDGSEYEYARLLYEDRNNEAQSYVDWLMHLHRQISLEVAGHRSQSDAGTFGGLRNFWG